MSREILIALILISICMLIAIVATKALEPKPAHWKQICIKTETKMQVLPRGIGAVGIGGGLSITPVSTCIEYDYVCVTNETYPECTTAKPI